MASKNDKDSFFKKVLLYLVIFTVVLTPIQMGVHKLGGIRLFAGTANIMRDMEYIVDPNSPFYKEFKDSDRVNVLALGVDGGMTDVIMVGSYDLKNQRVDVISVPRDTYYEREGRKGASLKINAVYSSEDVIRTAEAVSDVLLGMPINYYVVIDYDDVREIVGSMGGVPIYIEKPMRYTDPYDKPPLRINIPAGQQTLDGDKAVEYLRYRAGYAQGDIGRIDAHRKFIEAAFAQTLKSGLVDVAKTAIKTVESDISLGKTTQLAMKAATLDSEDMQTWMVPGKSGTRGGLSYWFPDEGETEDMIYEMYKDAEEE
ncbi:MAG: LCP family protein [Eubacteriales bacterium]|nr:LCP family protein [Eubacteriales bacterium]MDD4390811.1 LCP family protein [Eubacteriales bacterium]